MENPSPASEINSAGGGKSLHMPPKAQGLVTGREGKLRQKQLAQGHSESFCDLSSSGVHLECCSSWRRRQSEASTACGPLCNCEMREREGIHGPHTKIQA